MIEWLNTNDGAALAFLTLVYVGATVILVRITAKGTRVAQESLQAAERFERERSRPYVTVNLVNRPPGVVQLRLENIGATAAYKVRIMTKPEIMILKGGDGVVPAKEIAEIHPFIAKGIAFLPPGLVEENVVTLKYERYRSEYGDAVFEGSVEYQDKNGHSFIDPLIIDLAAREGTLFLTQYEVGKELHEIREILRKKLG